MVTSKIEPFKKPIEQVKRTPEEILRLESLLLDNWRKMVVERIKSTIESSKKTVLSPRPMWLTREEIESWNNDMENIKIKISAYEELLQLPESMMSEYSNADFKVNYTKNI